MNFEFSERIKELPPYVFVKIDKIKQAELKKGRKLITLGIGDPDLPTPGFIIDRMTAAARKPENHKYPSYWGRLDFRQAVARFMKKRFDVTVDPETEALALIGSKEGIAHLPLAFVNPGEATLVPDPAYPVYQTSTIFAGGKVIRFPLLAKNDFLPEFSDLEARMKGHKTKILFLNYPNNPTSGCATLEFFRELVRFAKKHELIVCHDNAYSEIYYDGAVQPSFLQVDGAKDVGVEFQSLSKTYNMAGWRVGFVCGNSRIIEGLAQIKTNIDSGVFNVCLEAGIEAMDNGEGFVRDLRGIYQRRRDILMPALQRAGLTPHEMKATFYAWCKLPAGRGSEEWVMDLIARKGIISTPGNGFGDAGEGYVRFTLCSDAEVLKQVAEALSS